MLDRLPDNYESQDDWFNYFRLTKYLPAIQGKFEREFPKAPSAEAALTIMTGYAGCALDIVYFIGRTDDRQMTQELKALFNIRPADFFQLSVHDLAALTGESDETMQSRLSGAGFSIQQGRITDFSDPNPAASPVAKKPALKP